MGLEEGPDRALRAGRAAAPAIAPTASARVLNAALGVWLFISAFAWPHTLEQRTNTWILGVLAFVFSLLAMSVPRMRFLNTILAVWLFISAWTLPRISPGTVWNNVIVAIAIFVVSLVPSSTATPSSVLREKPASPVG